MSKMTFWLNLALVVCFIATIALGVTLYVFYQMNAEAKMRLAGLTEIASVKSAELMVKQSELEEFKKIISGPDSKATVADIIETHKNVMEQYAMNFSESARTYTNVLSYLYNQILVQRATLVANKEDAQKLTTFNENRDKSNSRALKKVKEHTSQVAEYNGTFVKNLAEFDSLQNAKKAEFEKLLKDTEVVSSKEIDALNARIDKERANIRAQMEQNVKVRASMQVNSQVDVKNPDGSILFVSATQGTATIDLGSQDGLSLRTSFTVYPSQETNMETGVKKGSIQVVQITGPHSAECKILSDNPSNPVLKGDKIYSPVWNAHATQHYAIAGFIDLDGDGMSDISRLIQIIESNGGVVDGYQNGSQQVRRLESTTNLLVLGVRPDEKTPEAERQTYQKFVSDAKEFRVPTVNVKDLLDKMGVDANRTNVIKGGADTRPAPVDSRNFSGGSVSGLYMDDAKPEAPQTQRK